MRIIQLIVEGIKRIKAVDIEPESGKPVVLTGDNAQGKSSILDAIVEALQNKGLEDPLRHGSTKGTIKLLLGDNGDIEYEVTRKVTPKGTYLDVRDAMGQKVARPQQFLNDLIGAIAFDPHEFARLKDSKKRREILVEITGLDTTEIDAQIKQTEEDRTIANRLKRSAEEKAKAIVKPKNVPKEIPDAGTLVDELDSMKRIANEKKDLSTALAGWKVDLQNLEKRKLELEEHIKSNQEAIDAGEWPTKEQYDAKKAELDGIQEMSQKYRDAKAWKEAQDDYKAEVKKAAKVEEALEGLRLTRQRAINHAKMPLEGLELTENDLTYNGVIFEQLSTAEQVRVSFAIAVSQNPKLRVALIREGALMNREAWSWMEQLCKDEDFQLWIEKFQEDPGSTGFHIEDGEVAFVDGEAVEEAFSASDSNGEQGEPVTAGNSDPAHETKNPESETPPVEPEPEPEPEQQDTADDDDADWWQ